MKKLLLTSLVALMSFSSFGLTLKVDGLRGRAGKLMVAAFNDPGQFPDKKPFMTATPLVVKGSQEISVDLKLPAGDYAIAVFLDENSNGKIDTNILGIPKELFGFSNNPRILTGAPSYQDCDIRIEENSATTIHLIKFL